MTSTPYGYCHCGCGRETNRWKYSDRSAGRVKGEPARYINGHQPKRKHPSAEERLWRSVNKDAPNGCWEWTLSTQFGYGTIRVDGERKKVHRFAYELLVGPIPEGLTIDHLCKNRRCVNPAHLEPVTSGENALRGDGPPAQNARKTHCKRGHLLDEANVYDYHGRRCCRTCRARYSLDRHPTYKIVGELV